MSGRLHIVIDVSADSTLRDPHDIAQDILDNGGALPTFSRGVTFELGFEGTSASGGDRPLAADVAAAKRGWNAAVACIREMRGGTHDQQVEREAVAQRLEDLAASPARAV